MLNKAGKVEGDLRIGRLEIRGGGRDAARFAKLVDLDHPGHDGAARILPHEPVGQYGRQAERAEKGITPALCLDAGGADALVPDLRRALVGRLCLRRLCVPDRRPFEHWKLILLFGVDGSACTVAITGAHGVRGKRGRVPQALPVLHGPRPGRRAVCLSRIR